MTSDNFSSVDSARPTFAILEDDGTSSVNDTGLGQSDDSHQFIATLTSITNFIRIYVDIVIVCIGISGNILSLVIFRRYKNKDHASVFYLSWLSGMDLSNLILYIVIFWAKYGLNVISGGRLSLNSILETHLSVCKLSRYLVDTTRFMSAWIIIAFSIERCFAVWFPVTFAMKSSTKGRRLAIICLLLIGLLTNIPILIYFNIFVEKGTEKCFYELRDFDAWVQFLIVFVNITAKCFALPCAVLISLNTLIVIGIYKSKKSLGKVLNKKQTTEKKCLINLLIVSTVYVILNLPYVILWTYYNIENFFYNLRRHSPAEIQMLHSIGNFCTSLTVMNYSLNFIIYAQSLDYYRTELARIAHVHRCCQPCRGGLVQQKENSESDVTSRRIRTASNQDGASHSLPLKTTEIELANRY